MPVPDLATKVELITPATVIVFPALPVPVAGVLSVTTLVAALTALTVVEAAIPVPEMAAPMEMPWTELRVMLVVPAVKPALRRLVPTVGLFAMEPEISPVPVVDPCRVSVLLPTPVAVKSLVNFSKPLPD